MISDHSEVMSTIQSKISALNAALNDKEDYEARSLADSIARDMASLILFLNDKIKSKY